MDMGLGRKLTGATLLLFSSFLKAEEIKLAALDYPPHYGQEQVNNGPIGEIVKRVFGRDKQSVELLFVPWSRALSWAEIGRIDGILGAWYTEERTELFYFSDPIYPNEMVFYQKRGSNISYRDYQDLAQQKLILGSVRGYALVSGLEESGITIQYLNNDLQSFQMLAKGRIDLVLVDKAYGQYVLAKPEFQQVAGEIELIDKVLERRQQYLMLSKNAPGAQQKLKWFNFGLKQMKQNGEMTKLLDKHGIQLAQQK